MARKGADRRKLPRGLTRTPTGWRISVVRKGFPPYQKRFRADTPMDELEDELRKAQRSHTAGKSTAVSGTMAADVKRYLNDFFAGRPGLEERTRHLDLWIAALGADVRRAHVTRDDVARILNGWRATGLAADTCNKRRTALLALYHALDGRSGSNPVREIQKFRAPDPLPRGLAYPLIEEALEQFPACKTRARLSLMAYTGIRHGQVMQLRPDHWDHKRHVLTVPGTDKGRGTKPYTIPLSSQAQAALKDFDAMDAWGSFTWAPMARMWRQAWYAATTKQARTWKTIVPKAFVAPVPYDLRHSFGTAIYRASGDLKATKELMGHSAIRMTERYTLAAIPERQAAAMRSFELAVTPPKKDEKPNTNLPEELATEQKD